MEIMTDYGFPLLALEILTLLLIGSTVSKYPVQGDELSVSNGDGSPLNPTSSLQSLISELKCGILFRGPCPSGLSHRGFQPAVPLSDLAALPLTGAAVVSRTYAGP